MKKFFLPSFLLAISLVALDKTVVATALPEIASAFQSTINYSWVATAYLLSAAVAMPIAGRITDLAGGRRPLLGAFTVFTIGSLLCGLAPDMQLLILARAFQGIGGGAMLAVGTAVVGLKFEGRKRTKIFAMLAAFTGASAAMGPLIGGVLTEYASWRWIFFLNFPLGVLALAGLQLTLEEEEKKSSDSMDWAGAVLCAGWTIPLFFAFSWGGSTSSWTSPLILGLFATSLVAIIAFGYRESNCAAPLFDLGLFSDRAFRFGSSAYFFLGAATTTVLLFLPLYLIQIQGLTAPHAGLILSSEVFGLMIGNVLAGRITQSSGRYYGLLMTGNLIALFALYGLRETLSLEPQLWLTVGCLMTAGLGLGLAMPVYLSAVQNSVNRARMGTASSALQFSRILGAALGTALMGTMMVSSLNESLPEELEKKLEPLGIKVTIDKFEEPSHLQELFIGPEGQAKTKLQEALGGDETAQLWLEEFLNLSASETASLKTDSANSKTQLTDRLDQRIKSLEDGLEQSSRQALLEAIQRVYFGAVAFMLLTLLCTLLIPNVPIKDKASEESESSS